MAALEPQTRPAPPPPEAVRRLAGLRARYEGVSGAPLLEAMIRHEFADRIALVSSFGAEASVLLHMAAEIEPALPVIFLNTGKLFPETLRYRDLLQDRLGLTDLRVTGPHPADRKKLDPDGTLWNRNPDACCHFRKVLPLERALTGFEASITGRKRFQTGARTGMALIELTPARTAEAPPRFTINPLALWTRDDLDGYTAQHRLPPHPLQKEGFASIGCMPCTERVGEGEDYRGGRWAGSNKEECGIHLPAFEDGGGI